MNRSVIVRRRWLGLIGAALLVFSAACQAPIVPEAAAPPATSSAVASAPEPTATAVPATMTATATTAPTATVVPSPSATATTAATATATPVPATATPEPTPTDVPPAAFDPALAATLQRILDQTVADGEIPGAVLSVSLAGQEPWSGASGIADRQQRRPIEPTTNMRIASISKIFTAVVVLQLVEEGRIDLDASLASYLPDLLPNGDAITVRSLLQHTTGLYDYLEDRNYAAQAYQSAERRFEPRELVTYAAQFPPAFQPNAPGGWDYSSTNFVILGMIVERVTGNPLAQEMRLRIFEPIGLDQTFFAPDEVVPATAARGYSQQIDRAAVAMSFAYATANLVSTADNVRRFGEALVGGELLSQESLAAMYSFVNGKAQYNMPQLEYGLGLMRNRLPVGPDPSGQARPAAASTVIGHTGGFAGFRSALWSAPDGSITIALSMNQGSTDPNTLATRVFDAILTHQGR